MDQIERDARMTQLEALKQDVREYQEELRQLDKHSSGQASDRHRALGDQIKAMRAIQAQMEADLNKVD
jgi:hypothetical protein